MDNGRVEYEHIKRLSPIHYPQQALRVPRNQQNNQGSVGNKNYGLCLKIDNKDVMKSSQHQHLTDLSCGRFRAIRRQRTRQPTYLVAAQHCGGLNRKRQ
jgi:hypothetical protein